MWKSVQPTMPVLLGIGFIEAALGVLNPLIGIRLSENGIGSDLVGIVASAYFVGFLIGTLTCHRIIDRVGHIRAFGVFAVMAANATLLMIVIQHPYVWIVLRVAAGYTLAGAFVIIESWLNDKATEDNRGRIFAVYSVVAWGASGISPLALNIKDPSGTLLFALATICIASSMIPLALTKVGNPEIGQRSHLSILQLIRISPLGVVCCFGAGIFISALYSLLPVYITARGGNAQELAFLISIGTIAAILAQYPIGHIADHYGRRPIIIGTMILSSLLSIAFTISSDMPYLVLLTLFFLLTGFSSPTYALGVSQATDYIEKRDFVAASSGLLFIWGLGSSVGPFTVGLLMVPLGPNGLFQFLAAGFALVALFALYRVFRRRAKSAAEQSNYVAVPVGQGAVGAPELDPRGEAVQHGPSPAVKEGFVE
ncbi:MAG: MFS transporter [Rhodospirillaceae bacterium]|nr:MAG: MFS transporter [Rhodospirillaceae bacterium]